MAKEVARQITAKEKEYLLSLKEKDIDLNLLKDLFAYRKDQNPKFQPFDEFTLNPNEFYNKNKEETTVGRLMFNKYALGENLLKKLGYQNMTMGKGGIGDLDDLMSKYLLTDKITSEDMAEYIDRVQYFGFATAKFMNAALTIDLLIPPENVEKRKAELSKQYAKELEAGNVLVADKMEKELLGLAKETVQYIPDQQIYDSGCRGSYGNNYKNSTIMRGAIRHLSDDKITISTKSLVDGIPQEEFAAYADLITQASYNRAIGTREGSKFIGSL